MRSPSSPSDHRSFILPRRLTREKKHLTHSTPRELHPGRLSVCAGAGSGTFCSRSWPRASALPRSSVMVTSHSCWTRPCCRGSAITSARPEVAGRRKSVALYTDRELPAVPYRQAGAEAGGGLDGGGVDTALHHAPRGVVIWPEVDVTGDPGSAGRIHHQAGRGQEPAGSPRAEIDVGVRARLGIGRILHDTVVAEDEVGRPGRPEELRPPRQGAWKEAHSGRRHRWPRCRIRSALATTTAIVLALEVATFRRCGSHRNSSPRGASSATT